MSFVQLPPLILFAGRNDFLRWATGWSFQSFMVYHRWIARVMYFNAWYEVFLVLHLVFVSVFIVSLWYHCIDLGWMEYLYTSMAVWAFDRVVRILRLLTFGPNAKADIKIIGDIIHIEVAAPFFQFAAKPGSYAYIHILRFNFWENHPFSLLQVRDGKCIFVAKAKNGLTLKLWNYLDRQPNKTATLRVWIDGLYGEKYQVEPFDTVLLIAGEIGISAIASYADHLKNKIRNGQHVIVYWIVHSEDSLPALRNTISDLQQGDVIDFHIYVTSKTNGISSDDAFNNIQHGRPDIYQVISETIRQANSSVAIAVCGPDSLNDACRHAAASNVDRGKARIF
ncbi:FAD-binding domain-containing protein [Lipomyces japonicus]|uniref:FAD-binding domain-containing protein n=1 Tax=Lipomyces japonicus TaxID=56871 RepID=UPI0034CF6E67